MLSDSPDKNDDMEATGSITEDWENLYIDEDKRLDQDGPSNYDEKALRMMQKMGYKDGTGLGKNAQGITESIDLSYQLGKKGLGMKLKNLNSINESWDFSREEIRIQEDISWLANSEESNFDFAEMLLWIKEGPPKHDIINEIHFCDPEIVRNVVKAKDIFEELDIKELGVARTRSNPFETIRSVFFMNRAALKIANIDAATDFMFTKIDENEHHKILGGPFFFADVCAGPGGFSEYILWRKQWFFKGFGLTLKDDDNDFKLNQSSCACPVTFQPLYGKDGDGNICSPDNIIDFRDRVLHATDRKGVHFMMSDGGFSVEGNENLQEILSKNIYICQCLVALGIVRAHGHFVTKLFDTFTPFSVGLIYLLYKCFEKITIMKPNTSRPANAERYLICYNLKDSVLVQKIRKYLGTIVKKLWNLRENSTIDVLEIVPLEILKADEKFDAFIIETNERLAVKQIIALEKLATFCRNPTLVETRQMECRSKCLELWQIPDNPKITTPLPQLDIDDYFERVKEEPDIFYAKSREIDSIDRFNNTITNVEDWQYCCMYSSKETPNMNFYAAVGNSRTMRLQKRRWARVKNVHLCIGTLLFGEFVKEKCLRVTEGAETEVYKYSLHVIDALRLGEADVGSLSFSERMRLIKIYCAAVNKEYHASSVRVRPKPIYTLTNITSENPILADINGKMYCNLSPIGYNNVSEEYYVSSLLLKKPSWSQTFRSAHSHRVQIFLKSIENNSDNGGSTLSLRDIISEIKQSRF